MDQRTYDAAQQGLMASMVGVDHEIHLQRFLQGLRSAPEWTKQQVEDVEYKVRNLLGMIRLESWATGGIG